MNRGSRFAVEKMRTAIFAVALILMATSSHCSEAIYFDGPSVENPEKYLLVKGWLTLPEREGPRPSVIMLHGGSGLISDSYQPCVEKSLKMRTTRLTSKKQTVNSHGDQGRASDIYTIRMQRQRPLNW